MVKVCAVFPHYVRTARQQRLFVTASNVQSSSQHFECLDRGYRRSLLERNNWSCDPRLTARCEGTEKVLIAGWPDACFLCVWRYRPVSEGQRSYVHRSREPVLKLVHPLIRPRESATTDQAIAHSTGSPFPVCLREQASDHLRAQDTEPFGLVNAFVRRAALREVITS